MKLNEKHKRFCDEYRLDFNGTQAAIRAGYSAKTAKEQASRLLTNANIQLYIQQLQKDLSEKSGITAERILQELSDIGYHNIKDFVNGGNSILELKSLDKRKTSAVASVKTTVSENGVTTEIKMHNKITALELMGKHIGLFEKDNKQKQPVVKLKVGYGKRDDS